MKILLENYLIAKTDFFLNIAKNLENQGHEVYFLTEIEGPFYRYCLKNKFKVLRPKFKNKHTSCNEKKFEGVHLIHSTRRRKTVQQIDEKVIQFYESYKEEIKKIGIEKVFVFNGLAWFATIIAKELKIPCIYMENGYFPNTLQIDDRGVNRNASFNTKYDSFLKIKQKKIINHDIKLKQYRSQRFTTKLKETYYQIKSRDLFPLKKYIWTAYKKTYLKLIHNKPIPSGKLVFLVFQVHDDTQILANSEYIKSMEQFVKIMLPLIKKNLPEHKILVKEHPEDILRISYSKLKKKFPQIIWIDKGDFKKIMAQSEYVITVNSSVGFQALAEGKKVLTLGDSFYQNNPFLEHAKKSSEIEPKLKKLIAKKITYDQLRKYMNIYKNQIFIRGNPTNFNKDTINQIINYILR